MSVQSVGNSLSTQQILQLLQNQGLGTADPDATGADGAEAVDSAGQKLPGQAPQDDAATGAAPAVTAAKASLDPGTIKALLQIQESQNMAAQDTLIYGPSAGGSTGDPLLDALNGNDSAGGADPFASLMDQLAPAQMQDEPQQTVITPAPAADATFDPAKLQSMLESMMGSAQSGDAIASLTQQIMSFLDTSGETAAPSESEPASVASVEA